MPREERVTIPVVTAVTSGQLGFARSVRCRGGDGELEVLSCVQNETPVGNVALCTVEAGRRALQPQTPKPQNPRKKEPRAFLRGNEGHSAQHAS